MNFKLKSNSDTTQRYSAMSRCLHWLMAGSLIGMLTLGFLFEDMSPIQKSFWVPIHAKVGILLLLTLVYRLFILFKHKAPEFPKTMKNVEKTGAKFAHRFLYFLMLWVPLSGWLMIEAQGKSKQILGEHFLSFGMQNRRLGFFMKESHEISAKLLAILSLLHLVAVIYHHFIRKEGTLKRML